MSQEKAIAAAVEPIIEDQVELRAAVEQLRKKFDEPVKFEVDPDEIAAALMLKADLVAALKGAPGKDGENGTPGAPGFPGKDGRDGYGIDAPRWEPGIYRKDSVVTHGLGCVSVALCDTTQEPEGDHWKRIGSGGFRWMGAKHAEAVYRDGDLYIDDGSTFLWFGEKGSLFARRGRDGRNGKNGQNGRDGMDAPSMIDAHFLDECKTLALVMSNGQVIECPLPPLLYEAVTQYPQINGLRDELKSLREEVKKIRESRHGE
jgi:hypothetical protein